MWELDFTGQVTKGSAGEFFQGIRITKGPILFIKNTKEFVK